MNLAPLLQSAGIPAVLADPEISALSYDSRTAGAGSLFFALPGAKTNGAEFAQQAAGKGAAAVVAESSIEDCSCPVVRVPDARAAMADIAAAFYGHPDRSLKCAGVTGTNGKTTSAFLMKHLLDSASLRSGLIGTVKYVVGQEEISAPRTTPESADLQEMLARMRDSGSKAVAMEVSSHALVQQRVRGIEFDVAVFTNFTQDHLDYHRTMEAYFDAKSLLFESLAAQTHKKGRAIINADDRHGHLLLERFVKKVRTATFGRGVGADFRASAIQFDGTGSVFQLDAKRKSFLVRMPLIGLFNIYNALAALAASAACGNPNWTLTPARPSSKSSTWRSPSAPKRAPCVCPTCPARRAASIAPAASRACYRPKPCCLGIRDCAWCGTRDGPSAPCSATRTTIA